MYPTSTWSISRAGAFITLNRHLADAVKDLVTVAPIEELH